MKFKDGAGISKELWDWKEGWDGAGDRTDYYGFK